jgi:F-type H+-transporting ATPase subunit epsilon
MKLEIITPEKEIFNGEVKSIKVPGKSGEFEMLNNHTSIISTLTNGEIRIITTNDKTEHFTINGGVIEMLQNRIIVLAN